jgi:hypothetical protein
LSDDLPTIARLARYGIAIADDIQYELAREMPAKKVVFASQVTDVLEMDADLVIEYIKSVDTDFVLMSEWFGINKTFSVRLREVLDKENIKFVILDRRKTDVDINLSDYKMPIILSGWSFVANSSLSASAGKTINIVNSNPISIK